MFKNYFKIAIRSLAKQKRLAAINIFGLSVGIACFSLFLLYAVNEFTYDHFHRNADNIYRVYLWIEAKGAEPAKGMSYQPMPLGPAMKKDLPDVENYVRVRGEWGESFIQTENKITREEVTLADPSFFSVFSFKLKSGDPVSALTDLHSVVLTEATAEKLFGNKNPVGKIIRIKLDEQFEPFTITAVAENPPTNSSIQFKILGNFNYLATTPNGQARMNNWHQYSYQTFVKLKPGSHLPSNKNSLVTFRKKYLPDEEENSRKSGWKGITPRVFFGLQPLGSMHTDIRISGGGAEVVDPKTIWILLTMAGGILLIACINFTTLAIGRSAGRSKEVGVRKVIGGSKKSLILQFLTEAFLLTLISALIGFLLADLFLPFFNRLSARELNLSFTQYPQMIGLTVGLLILVAVVAGGYPALILAGIKPIEALRTKVKLGGSNIFTKSLVTLQFVLSTGLIISTLIILQQLKYMRSRNPGFNKENVIIADASGMEETKKVYALLKHELVNHPEILGTASAEVGLGGGQGWSQSSFQYKGKDKSVYEYFVDPDYLHVLGLQLLTGRNFDFGIASDTLNSIIINEAMMKDFGWTLKNAIGQRITGYNDQLTPVVIGVVKDFNYFSFSQTVQPQMFHQFSSYMPYRFFVRVKAGDPSRALAILQAAWKKVTPDYPLKYSFLDENLDLFYKSEARWSQIVGWAGGISIFLAGLGLLGLAALAVINRTKEIGIRKVLGASFSSIIRLLSKDFLKLICIAFVIATSLAYYFMNKWLQAYSYRIRIPWWAFAGTGVVVVALTLIIISLQAIKATSANPVKSLSVE